MQKFNDLKVRIKMKLLEHDADGRSGTVLFKHGSVEHQLHRDKFTITLPHSMLGDVGLETGHHVLGTRPVTENVKSM
jgi:hypothetical protein